jgi:hypothetical protein
MNSVKEKPWSRQAWMAAVFSAATWGLTRAAPDGTGNLLIEQGGGELLVERTILFPGSENPA